MMKILHFADAHINAVQSGRWDPETGQPVRVMDFLKSLDTIVDTAIEEKVDLVLFAGDAYKDANPTPAQQALFASRILRLEDARIPTILLVGNHDKTVRNEDHALTEFKTFKTKHIHVVDTIRHRASVDFDIIFLPWVHKSQLITGEVIRKLETLIEGMDPNTPNIFLGHCSVVGASFSSERLVMLGEDLMLPKKLLTESGFDYVALGHIHKHQEIDDLIIYPGSIERVDWGEAGEDKGFIIADVRKDSCDWKFHKLNCRPMLDYKIVLEDKESIMDEINLNVQFIPAGAMIRIKLQYPENWAGLINNQTIEHMFPDAFSVQVVHDPIREGRTRLDLTQDVAAYAPGELLEMWMGEKGVEDQEELLSLAKELMNV